LVGSAFCFGWIGTLMRQIHTTPTATVVVYRLLIGMATLGLLARGLTWPKARREQLLLIASGLLYGVTALLYIGSYRYTSIAKAGFLHYLAPLFVMLLAPLVLREKPQPLVLAAAGLAVPGVLLLLKLDLQHGLSLTSWRGDALAAASAVTFRVAAGDWPGVIGLGVIASALAFALFYRGLRFIPAAQATLIMLLSPVTNALLGYLLADEGLTPGQVVGAGLILTAAALAAQASSHTA
jgi:DME family drug/metabolite transporter